MTPTYFRYLRLRQRQAFAYEKYLAYIPASAIYNVNRGSVDAPYLDPIDFIRERHPKEEQIKEIKVMIKDIIGKVKSDSTPEKYQQVRRELIDKLIENGVKDAEAIFDECWPSLKPNK
jgi:hypothetical protein